MRRSTRLALWAVLALWAFGRKSGGSSPAPVAPGPAPSPPSGGGAGVPARLTPASAADVAGAIVRGYTRLRGAVPPATSSWLWPLALSSNETAAWRQLFNWNVGNVTASSGQPWFANPHVTAPLRFVDCATLDDGAYLMLRTLDAHGGLAAADAGDAGAWQLALDKYLGSGKYPDLSALAASLASTVPSA